MELAGVMESNAGEKPAAGCAPGAPDGADMFWWEQQLSCGPGVMLFVGASRRDWVAIGARVLTAAGIESTEDEARSTYQEVVTQALSALADSLGARAGTEIHAAGGKQVDTPPSNQPHRIRLRFQDGESAAVYFDFTPDVVRLLTPAPPEEPQSETETEAAAPTPMDLLLDVELPITVTFGRAEVRLQDVLKLNTGSIIELDRTISEPVELVVNNCVIARGEVVVVDGNYGVKISQIVSRNERLRTSRRSLNSVRRCAGAIPAAAVV